VPSGIWRISVDSAVTEIEGGNYNNTYRVNLFPMNPMNFSPMNFSTGELAPGETTVILRVAPSSDRQFRSEREFMRNEYSSAPFLAPVISLMPRILMADFTQEIIDRDYLFQSFLSGTPAPQALSRFPRPPWTSFYRQLGVIARQIHAIEGPHFGPIRGPGFSRWSEALVGSLKDIHCDLIQCGLDASDLREVISTVEREVDLLDQITQPRLLHGDLWTVNVMLSDDTPEPKITGIFDCDRTLWGDPEADWTIFMAGRKQDAQRKAFWQSYGLTKSTPEADRRSLFYEARHICAIRLEHYRLGHFSEIPGTHDAVRTVLARLKV
jgi:aminoglycoside phosphotransferase (APT) family kinase protein